MPFQVTFDGTSAGATANLEYITAPFNASSTIGNNVVETRKSTVAADNNGEFAFELPEFSVAILEVKADSAGGDHDYQSHHSRSSWKRSQHWAPGGVVGAGWKR